MDHKTDTLTQWLRHSSSTTSSYEGVRDSHSVSSEMASSRSNNSWRPQQPQQKVSPRMGRSAAQGRGAHQSEYWKQFDASEVDIYSAVDSCRPYDNGHRSIQAMGSAPTYSDEDFDPFSQVFQHQAHNNADSGQAQHHSQVNTYFYSVDPSYPYPSQPQARDSQHYDARPRQPPRGGAISPVYSQFPQYGQDQRSAAHAQFRPYGPMRSVLSSARHHPYRVDSSRFSNSVQERQQAYGPGSDSWRLSSQSSSSQQFAYRPMRGVDRPGGFATSRDQPMQSVEQGQTNHTGQSIASTGNRRPYLRHSTPRRREAGTVSPPPAPCATQAYLIQAHLPPTKLDQPKRLLVILDLNGTLVLKPEFRKPDDIRVRPGAPKLLDYLFAHHQVMVYTSGQPHNAEKIARRLFSVEQYDRLASIWARDKLDLTPAQYKDKVQVYKKLDKIWNTPEIQASFFPAGRGRWDQTNTILVDDSHLKALQEPHNLLQIPEFKIFDPKTARLKKKALDKREEQICQSLVMKLEVLMWQNDVSRLIWRWQTGQVDIPRAKGSNVFVDEKVDQREQARKDLEAAINMPTPQSPETSDVDSEDEGGGSVLPKGTEGRRSESPIDEAVFKELLSGGKTKDIPTPESQDG